MTEAFIYSIISVIIVSVISLIGIFTLTLSPRLLKKSVFVLVSLAVGALLGDALIHLFPEALEETGSAAIASFYALLGMLVFFVLEKFLHWHHHTEHVDEELLERDGRQKINPLGYLILASDSFHNLIDGMIIGASFMVNTELGIATTIAVVLHEIPQEIGDFGVLIHSGFSKLRALLVNFGTALFALLGVSVAFLLQNISENIGGILAAFAAGSFLYIAGSDLVPELQKTRRVDESFLQFVAVVVGMGLMFALLLFE